MADARSIEPTREGGSGAGRGLDRLDRLAVACLAVASLTAIGCARDHGKPEKAMLTKISRLEALRGDAYASARDSLLESHARELLALAPDTNRNIPDTRHALLARAKDPARTMLFLGALDHTNYAFWDRRMHTGQPRPDQVLEYLKTFDAVFFPLIEENLISLRSGIRTTSWSAVAALYKSRNPDRGFKIFSYAYGDPGSSSEYRSQVLGGIRELNDSRTIPLLRQAMRTTADRNERTSCLYALAALQDPELRPDLERALEKEGIPDEDRILTVRALAQYHKGSESDVGLVLYRRFSLPATRRAVLGYVFVNTPQEAEKWRAMSAQETDPQFKAAIENKLADFPLKAKER